MTTHYGRDALKILTNNCEAYLHIEEGEQVKFNHLDCPSGVTPGLVVDGKVKLSGKVASKDEIKKLLSN